jgi:hypothetical protein
MEINQNRIKEMRLNSNKAKHFKVDEGDIQKVEESACLGSVI